MIVSITAIIITAWIAVLALLGHFNVISKIKAAALIIVGTHMLGMMGLLINELLK